MTLQKSMKGAGLGALLILGGCGMDNISYYERRELETDLHRTRVAEITDMRILNENSDEVDPSYFVFVRYPDSEREQVIQLFSCSHGPDFGTPEEIFSAYETGDSINIRISNGIAVDPEGDVSRYTHTTHLDKGYVNTRGDHENRETDSQVRCAGALRPYVHIGLSNKP